MLTPNREATSLIVAPAASAASASHALSSLRIATGRGA
jgi:hypothetical protein